MGNKKSKLTAHKWNDALKKGKNTANASQNNVKMVQNVLLIWVDENIDENNTDYQNTTTHLRTVINTINMFKNVDDCIQFLEEVHDEKVCMIVSGSLGRHIVPRVHNMFYVDSIFIFCGNKQNHEQWTKNWPKIKGIHNNIEFICDALKQSAKDCEQNAVGFSLVSAEDDLFKKNLDQLDPMFMYSQILKEILLVIEFEHKHILDFTQYCRETLDKDNRKQLENVKVFERDYQNKTPIWWYTWESFLYPMLNRALRTSDIDVIIRMGFFIGDLHRQIEDLHQQQITSTNTDTIFTVYRGQGMSREELEQLSKTKGGLISFNNFLSTSHTKTISMKFARRTLLNPDLIGVLFVMTIDPKQSTTPYASVAEAGAYRNEEKEILFAMHTVFRIKEVQQMNENPRLFRVQLQLTSDNDKELQVLTKRIREETRPDEIGWSRLGLVLEKLGKPKQAEEVYRILLQQQSEENKKRVLYSILGNCKQEQGEYKEAIELYEKSLEIYEHCSPNSHSLAKIYNNIGAAYNNTREYEKALIYFKKALVSKQQLLSSSHFDLASTYNNIGMVYKNMGEYTKALSFYEKSLEIKQQFVPSNHPSLAASYGNIGLLYEKIGDYSKVRLFFQKAFDIAEKSMPPNHPELQQHRANLDRVKNKL